MTTIKWPKYDRCSHCRNGIINLGDDFEECRSCGGSGQVFARDERGRFLPWDTIEVADSEESE